LVTNLWSNEILIHINTHTFHPSFSDFVSVHWQHFCWTSLGGAWRTYCRAGDTQEDQGGGAPFQTCGKPVQRKAKLCPDIRRANVCHGGRAVAYSWRFYGSAKTRWEAGSSASGAQATTGPLGGLFSAQRASHMWRTRAWVTTVDRTLSLNGYGYGTAHGHNLQYRPTFSHLVYTSH
jgi:hypothetical protein